MSDGTSLLSAQQMGTFDEDGNYLPRVITEDDMVGTDLATLVGDSVLEFEDGDLVTGTVVKIDHDEVLLDIGFKPLHMAGLGIMSFLPGIIAHSVEEITDGVPLRYIPKELGAEYIGEPLRHIPDGRDSRSDCRDRVNSWEEK